jgi:hypothetical protein
MPSWCGAQLKVKQRAVKIRELEFVLFMCFCLKEKSYTSARHMVLTDKAHFHMNGYVKRNMSHRKPT